jgi:hypothetical protein
LHEAVDQRGGQRRAGGGVDPAGRNEAILLRPEKALFPFRADLFLFVRRQRLGDPATHIVHAGFCSFGVFFDQDLDRNFLLAQWREFGNFRDFSQG